MLAAQNGYADIVQFLLSAQADATQQDKVSNDSVVCYLL
jgi:hypothetical protein